MALRPGAIHQHQVRSAGWRIPTKVFAWVCQSAVQPRRVYVCTSGAPQPWLSHFSDTSELTRRFRVPEGILRPGAFYRVSFSSNGRTKGLSLVVICSARELKMIRESHSSTSHHILALSLQKKKKKHLLTSCNICQQLSTLLHVLQNSWILDAFLHKI